MDEVSLRTSTTEKILVSHSTLNERSIISVESHKYPKKAADDHLPVF